MLKFTLNNQFVMSFTSDDLAVALKRLWTDESVCHNAYNYRLEFHLHESTKQLVVLELLFPKYKMIFQNDKMIH